MGVHSVCIAVLLVAVTGILSQRCTTTHDCECGYVCVSDSDTLPCPADEKCRCKEGCAVASMYIRPGSTVMNTFCNQCSCLGDPEWHNGVPVCSRARWCFPPGIEKLPVYQDNKNCDIED